ncbi:MAG: hypothetical protein IPH96_18010 [Saprospiraceae bacterium]|nr:hypothetical protein [Saprospiraceae bacterium]
MRCLHCAVGHQEQFEAAYDVFEIVTADDVVIYQSVDQYISKSKTSCTEIDHSL